MSILHFTNTTDDREYVVLTEDDFPAFDEHCKPGYELNGHAIYGPPTSEVGFFPPMDVALQAI